MSEQPGTDAPRDEHETHVVPGEPGPAGSGEQTDAGSDRSAAGPEDGQ